MEAGERREAALLRQIEDARTQLAAIADRSAAATASNILSRKSEEPREKGPFFRTPAMPQSMAGHTSMARFREAARPQDKRKDLPPPA